MRVLLTGATGFVGPAILEALLRAGHDPVLASRRILPAHAGLEHRTLPDLRHLVAEEADRLLEGTDAVIHAAGYAHAGVDANAGLHEAVNAQAAARIAEAAGRQGQRMVFLSSIKSLGAPDHSGLMREDQEARPEDAYGRAKHAAEQAIRAALPGRHVILRPCLVAGPGAKGNLAALTRLARLPVPLPFGAIAAKRSLISRDDLADLAVRAISEPDWCDRALIVADPEPLTIGAMIASIRIGMGRHPGVFRLPSGWAEFLIQRLGGPERAGRILTPLRAEPTFLLSRGWRPLISAEQALQAMGASDQRA